MSVFAKHDFEDGEEAIETDPFVETTSHRMKPTQKTEKQCQSLCANILWRAKAKLNFLTAGAPALPKAPFPHLLKGTSLPTSEEANEIKLVLQEADQVYSSLIYEELCRGPLKIRDGSPQPFKHTPQFLLLRKLAEAESFLSVHRGIISLLNHLPNELLLAILELTIPYEGSFQPWKCQTLPLNVSQVCSAWRNLVHSSPSLWVTLPPIELSEYTRTPGYVQELATILDRSGSCPISIFIFEQKDDKLVIGHPVLSAFIRHCHRWKSLRISGVTRAWLGPLRPIRGCLPVLEELYLGGSCRDSTSYIKRITELFNDCPRLHTVSDHCYLPFEISTQAPALRIFSAMWVSTERFIGLSIHSSNLHSLSLEQPFIKLSGPITFPSLTFLKVSDASKHGHANINFLAQLVVPSLKSLIIQSCINYRAPTTILHPILIMLSNSQGNGLTHLVIQSAAIDEEPGVLETLLRLTPSLKHLELTIPSLANIQNLSGVNSAHGTALVPHLATLKIHNGNGPLSSEIYDAIHELAKRGFRNQTSSLKCLTFMGPTTQWLTRLHSGWTLSSGETTCRLLRALQIQLTDEILLFRWSKPNLPKPSPSRLLSVLADIISVEVDDAQSLYTTDILNTVHSLHISPRLAPQYQGGSKFTACVLQAAGDVIHRWQPLVSDYHDKRLWLLTPATLEEFPPKGVRYLPGLLDDRNLNLLARCTKYVERHQTPDASRSVCRPPDHTV